MSTITRFEDLEIWKNSRKLANLIFDNFAESTKYSFKDQIERAATSVMNNIAEGFERGSDRDFTKFLYTAKASAGEVRSMLYLAEDRKYIESNTASQLREDYFRLSYAINKFIKYLNK